MKKLCLPTLGLLILVSTAFAGPANGAKEADKNTASSATTNNLVDVALPQSVFCLTNGPVKDPFFPNSTRTQAKQIVKSAPTPLSAEEFKMGGISGLPGNRLALINGYSFAEGESATVTTPIRKVFIKVLRIKEYSAVILVAGQEEPYEVFLAKNMR